MGRPVYRPTAIPVKMHAEALITIAQQQIPFALSEKLKGLFKRIPPSIIMSPNGLFSRRGYGAE
jgi:hypothetical protein